MPQKQTLHRRQNHHPTMKADDMTQPEKISGAEAILFAYGDPVPTERLAELLCTDAKAIPNLMDMLSQRYQDTGSALQVLHLGNCWQLCTRKDFADLIRTALDKKKNTPLSAAALEVLTIVAYNQPVSRSFIEHVRGIDSSSVVNTLIDRELLEEAGRLDIPGKPIVYRTTENFLRCFGLTSAGDLPPLPIIRPDAPPETANETDTEESAASAE